MNNPYHEARMALLGHMPENISAFLFAKFMCVKVKTIQRWEDNTKTPSKLAQRLMEEVRNNPKPWRNNFIKTMHNPQPGDMFVFNLDIDIAIEWLVVREHPDDNTLVLLVPTDDCSFIGAPDVDLSPYFPNERPLVARCGNALWFPKKHLRNEVNFTNNYPHILPPVKNMLAGLARGKIVKETEELYEMWDNDPNYLAHMNLVAQAREKLNQLHETK